MLKLKLNGYTYQYIAGQAGVTRQRIQQLLSPPRDIRDFVVKKYKGFCISCGIFVGKSGHIHHNGEEFDTYNDILNLQLLCLSCHRNKHKGDDSTYKYSTNTKTDRNRAIVEMRKGRPELSLRDIAGIFCISKARVCKIIQKNSEGKQI